MIVIGIAFVYKCPYTYIFGISCPGCGMTRAFLSLLKFDFEMAFYYHPLFWVVIMVVLYGIVKYLFHLELDAKKEKILFWIICFLFMSVYFLRLFQGSEVVSFQPERSIIYKIISMIKE